MNYYPGELFDSGADMMYYERIEEIFKSKKVYLLNRWELDFIRDLYWNPCESYSDKQKAVINRLRDKLGIY